MVHIKKHKLIAVETKLFFKDGLHFLPTIHLPFFISKFTQITISKNARKTKMVT